MNIERAIRRARESPEYRRFARLTKYDKAVVEALSQEPAVRSIRRELRRLAFVATQATEGYASDRGATTYRAMCNANDAHDAALSLIINSGLAAAIYYGD